MDNKTKKALQLTAEYLRTLNQEAFADAVEAAAKTADGTAALAEVLTALIDVEDACR